MKLFKATICLALLLAGCGETYYAHDSVMAGYPMSVDVHKKIGVCDPAYFTIVKMGSNMAAASEIAYIQIPPDRVEWMKEQVVKDSLLKFTYDSKEGFCAFTSRVMTKAEIIK